VVRGHLAYYAVPGNFRAVHAFRHQISRHWFKALQRRCQRTRLNWVRMNRLIARWLPPVRIMHQTLLLVFPQSSWTLAAVS
jgi:hypothetical protein